MTCFLLNFIIALCMKWLLEYIVFVVVFSLTRSYIDGLHFEKYVVCLIFSSAVINITLYYAVEHPLPILMAELAFILTFICIWIIMNRKKDDSPYKEYYESKIRNILILIFVMNLLFTMFRLHNYVTLITYTMLLLIFSILLGKIKVMWEFK